MSVKYDYEIFGNTAIGSLFVTKTLTLAGKVERTLDDLVVGDGVVSMSTTKLGTISYIIANSTSAKVTITAGGVDAIFNIKGLFVYDVDATYAATITAITVQNTSATAADCFIGIYGE